MEYHASHQLVFPISAASQERGPQKPAGYVDANP